MIQYKIFAKNSFKLRCNHLHISNIQVKISPTIPIPNMSLLLRRSSCASRREAWAKRFGSSAAIWCIVNSAPRRRFRFARKCSGVFLAESIAWCEKHFPKTKPFPSVRRIPSQQKWWFVCSRKGNWLWRHLENIGQMMSLSWFVF